MSLSPILGRHVLFFMLSAGILGREVLLDFFMRVAQPKKVCTNSGDPTQHTLDVKLRLNGRTATTLGYVITSLIMSRQRLPEP